MHRRALLAAAMLAAFGLPACGDTSKSDLVSQSGKICRETRAKLAKVPQPSRRSFPQLAAFADTAARDIGEGADRLARPDAPKELKGKYETFVKSATAQEKSPAAIARAARQKDRRQLATGLRLASIVDAQGKQAARSIGLTECAKRCASRGWSAIRTPVGCCPPRS